MATRKSKHRPRSLQLALEPRILFDGAAVIGAQDALDATREQQAPATPDLARPDAGGGSRSTLLVIDSRIGNSAALLAGLPDDVTILVVGAKDSGLKLISQALAASSGVRSLQILGHGSEGSFTLGTDVVDSTLLVGNRAPELASWAAGLGAGADILLYGCDTGAGERGQALISRLAALTGADVAASTDATGTSALGGNWALEVATGPIETHLALGALARDAFAALLAAPTVATSATGLTVIEPSTLNAGGASSATLTGWTINDDQLAGGPPGVFNASNTVTVDVTVADITKGTLSNPGGAMSGVVTGIVGGFRYVGIPGNAQTWVNQLVFTAADFELGNSAGTTSITVLVTDAESTPLSASASLPVTITPSNDPVLVPDGSAAIPEGSSGTAITAAALAAADPEVTLGTQNNNQIIYRLTTLPTYGYLTVSGSRVGVGSIFSQANVVANQLVYVHTAGGGANQNTADSFSVSVNDGATPQASSDTATVTLNITPANQTPTLSGSGNIYEGQPRDATTSAVPQSIVGNFITASGGGDPGDATLDLKVTSLPTHGTLYYNGTAVINGVSQSINRAIVAGDFVGSGFVLAYANRSGLTYSNDGIDPGGVPPDDSFNVSVTDGGGGLGIGFALTTSTTVTLDIKPVNDDPIWVGGSTLTATVTANGPDAIAANGDDFRVNITQAMLDATDVDSANTAISYVLTQLPVDGQLLLNNANLVLGGTFTRDDVLNNRVQYMQTAPNSGGANPTDTFKFQIRDNALSLRWDGIGEDFDRTGGVYDTAAANSPLTEQTFNLNLANTPSPTFTAGSGPAPTTPAPTTALTTAYVGLDPVTGTPISALSEGGTVTLTTAMLNYTAAGVPSTQVVYTIKAFGGVSGGWNGTLQKSGTAMSAYDTFTQDDVTSGRVAFVHDGGEDFESSVTLQVSAGGVSGGAPLIADNVLFMFYITPVNDNPTASGSSTTLITEGATVVIGSSQLSFGDPDDATSEAYYDDKLNSPFIDSNFALNNGYATPAIPAPDPLQFRISVAPTAGKLQYDTTGLGAWSDITAGATLYNADIIAANRLRYVHDGFEVRNDSFQAISRDRWGAESAAATVSVVITNINDAPEIAVDPTQADPSTIGRAVNNIGGAPANEPLDIVEEGGFIAITPAMLQGYDPDSSSQQVQYRITTAPAQGRVAYSTDGITFQTIGVGSSFSQAEVALGQIYFVHDGTEPTSTGYANPPDDKFFFTLADGDKEQAGNQFWVYVKPTNDAPTVAGPAGPIIIDSTTPANNPVAGFSLDDVDLATIAPVETDYLQLTVRLLTQAGTPFAAAGYNTPGSEVTISVAASGATIDADKDGLSDYLTLRGTKAQVNTALAGLKVTFADDRDAIYQVQVIADDRVRDLVTGVLDDADAGTGGIQAKANGGLLNQFPTPPGLPTVIPNTEYDWYAANVPAADPNIAAGAVTVWASHFNDPQTVTEPAAQTPSEDTAFIFSQANGNRIQIADIESSVFGLNVQLTLAVASGTLTVGSQAGVTVSGSGSDTVTLTGTATDIQTRLDAGFSYTGDAQYNDTDTLTITLSEDVAEVGGDVGAGSVQNANVVKTVSLDLVPINDAPAITLPAGPLAVGSNAAVAIAGVSLADANDFTVAPTGVQTGETDFVQATVRLLDASSAVITDYTGVSFGIAGGSGATTDATWSGVAEPLVLRGTLSQVNTALAGLTVTMDGDRDLSYKLQVLMDDRLRNPGGGLTGGADGGALNQPGLAAVPATDTFATDPVNTTTATATAIYNIVASSVDLFVSSSNDAPVNTLPTLTVAEDSTNQSVKNGAQYITVADADDFGANLTVVLTATGGSMSIGNNAGVSGDNLSAQTSLTLVGNKSNLNSVLQTLTFTPTGNLQGLAGVATIEVSTTDTALTGSGANQSDSDRLDVVVTTVNDQPSASSNVTLTAVSEDDAAPASTLLSTLSGSFGYSDATDLQTGFTNGVSGVSGGDTSTAVSYIAIVGSSSYTAAQGSWQIADGVGAGSRSLLRG